MNSIKNIHIALLLLYFSTPILGFCSNNGILQLRGGNSFPPFEYIDKKGKPKGFNIDMTKEIMKRINQPYTIELEDWGQVRQEFKDRSIDGIVGLGITDEEYGDSLFSIAHNYITFVAYTRRSDTDVKTLHQLKEKKIILVKGELITNYLNTQLSNPDFIFVTNIKEGLTRLSNGSGDVFIASNEVSQYLINEYKIPNLKEATVPLPSFNYCFAIDGPKGLLTKINGALVEIKRDGTLDSLYAKWFPYEKREREKKIAFSIGVLFLAILFTFILFTLILKRRVNRMRKIIMIQDCKYLTVFENSIVGYELYNIDGKLVNINKAACSIFGFGDKNSILSRDINLSDFVDYKISDTNDGSHLFSKIIKYDLRKRHRKEIFDLSERDEIVYIKVDINPSYDENGSLQSILCCFVEETAEKMYEQQLNILFNNLPITITIFDKKGNQEFLNNEGYKLFGITDRTSSSLCQTNIYNWIIEDESLKEKIRNGEDIDTIISYPQHNINNKWIPLGNTDSTLLLNLKVRNVRNDEDGSVQKIIALIDDETYEKKIESELNDSLSKKNFAMNSANMVFWEFDVISQHLSFLNYHHFEQQILTYDDFKTFANDEDVEQLIKYYDLMVQQKNESYQYDIRFKFPDNEWHYCSMTGVPFRLDKDQKVTRYIGFIKDNTHLIKIQKQLEEEKEHAEESDRLKSAFLANMSHEIRTPLNAIVGFSEIIAVNDNKEENNKFIKIIQYNNQILLRLINDILDLSKLDAGVIKLQNKEFDLAELGYNFQKFYDNNKLNDDVEFITDLPYSKCIVNLDEQRFMQVYSNFITNAIKYTKNGYIKFGYSYVDNGIKIYVKDTGMGIPKAVQNKLFTRFGKLNNDVQGNGLGLTICKAILEMQKGKIGFESEENKGSTFWAWFPTSADIELKDNRI